MDWFGWVTAYLRDHYAACLLAAMMLLPFCGGGLNVFGLGDGDSDSDWATGDGGDGGGDGGGD